jgi:ribosome-associated toxin RatA of RatAB toxin-antitoxin module
MAGASLGSMRGYAVAFLVLATVGQAADGQWQRWGERDGVAIDRRSVEGSSAPELRLTARSPVSPAAFMRTLWRHEEYSKFLPHLKRLDVLRDDGNTKLIYEQIHVPLVKDRDLTLRVTRSGSPAAGTYEIVSSAVPNEGPPESHDYVRVRSSLGRWRLAPVAGGGTAVTYTIRTDGGGRMPGWIVGALEKNAAVTAFRAMLDRARRNTS